MFEAGAVSWPWMLLAGLVMALNPCMLALTPMAAGYVGQQQGAGFTRRLRLSLLFIFGFAGTLAFLGLGVGWLGGFLLGTMKIWIYVVAIIYLLMGGYLLRLPQVLPWKMAGFYQSSGCWPRPRLRGGWGALALGGVLGLTPAPCTTPVVAAVLAYVLPSGNSWQGAVLLGAYGLGHGLPLLLGGIFGGLLGDIQAGRWWDKWIRPLVGLTLISLGFYFLFWGQQFFVGHS